MILVSPVIPSIAGDATTVHGTVQHVGPRCYCERVGYWCLSCRQLLSNFYQAELHVDDGRRHLIARDCGEHGLGAL